VADVLGAVPYGQPTAQILCLPGRGTAAQGRQPGLAAGAADRQHGGRSRPLSAGWPARIPNGDTEGSTARWPASASTSQHRPYGRSSKPAASIPAEGRPDWPGRNSCALQSEAILACDFFTVDLLDGTQAYVLAVIEHSTRRIRILGVTLHPTGQWTTQQARNLVMDLGERADRVKFMSRDRGSNFTAAFDAVLANADIRTEHELLYRYAVYLELASEPRWQWMDRDDSQLRAVAEHTVGVSGHDSASLTVAADTNG
jgi:hypothetical protein